jgi:hypothetical protein
MVSVPLLLLAAAFAGCLDSDADEAAPSPTYDPDQVPPGCATEAPAIAHGPGGANASWDGPLGIPCLVVSDWDTYEPSLGVTSAGNLFLYPSFTAPNEAT